jgi:REP element-mobilizing transposase RayT
MWIKIYNPEGVAPVPRPLYILSMPQSLSRVVIHSIFSTKNRNPFLRNPDTPQRLFKTMGSTAKNLGCNPIQIGGHVDHVHLLTTLSRTCTLSDFIKEVKRVSSGWMKEEGEEPEFAWQNGYGSFSVSENRVDGVIAYIRNQEEHHRKQTFQEEYREFLNRHNISYDERYVWD